MADQPINNQAANQNVTAQQAVQSGNAIPPGMTPAPQPTPVANAPHPYPVPHPVSAPTPKTTPHPATNSVSDPVASALHPAAQSAPDPAVVESQPTAQPMAKSQPMVAPQPVPSVPRPNGDQPQSTTNQTQTTETPEAPAEELTSNEQQQTVEYDQEMLKRQEQLQQLKEAILGGNVPQMVLLMISHALQLRSSDIHVEPLRNTIRMRFRVDGVLRQIAEYPPNLHPAVVSRIKIMSNLKIDEQRIPQDGRCGVTTGDNREMDLRVSTLPSVSGEKIVMRLQDKSRKIPDLPELGIEGISLKYIQEGLAQPNGIILTTGPTGSGKTTTLYSALTRLNTIGVNILTIEDPVEIALEGLNQSQVHPDIEYTFATGLRAALRQDPDIIMVGEIRDRETIDTAIEASLTGHLVLSTIHTNSAIETLTRIDNMGVPPFLMASTIEVIIAQRLVRKICPHCRRPAEQKSKHYAKAKRALEHLSDNCGLDKSKFENPVFYESPGCEKCENVGYLGRLGLYEVMRLTNNLRRMILDRESAIKIEKAAIKEGMMTLEQSGVYKALRGETSLEEVYRVARVVEEYD